MKTDIDDADVTFSGRVFHSREAATGKAQSPMAERRVCQTTSDDVDNVDIHLPSLGEWKAEST